METFFSPRRTWPDGPYLHFLITFDDPQYRCFVDAHRPLLASYGDRLGAVPPQWLHSTVQGVHHPLSREQVEQAVEAVRHTLAWDVGPMSVQLGPVWPGPSAVTVAMYPEQQLAHLNAKVRETLSKVDGIRLREADERFWPHSTAAYYRSPDVHDAKFNRSVRAVRPDRVDVTVQRVDAVYLHQDVERGYYRWDHLASLPLCGTPRITVKERLDELCQQAAREGSDLWREAWERAVAVVEPGLGREEISVGVPYRTGAAYADGAGTLAIAFYMLARETGAAISSITRQQVEDLAWPYKGTGLSTPPLSKRWTALLEALGHRADDPDDPVMVRWRALCYDHPEPDPDYDDASTYRVGHAGETGLQVLLAPFNRERVRIERLPGLAEEP
ncbi:2'-5' RNA ligase family protein [Streptomyces mobaraensis]|uniref:2'-5' RNA ligase family protein n=1 Tax=Streptomyces mobaraensis TaxID=35621 RepID=A0A5N5W314_STRMB|nr:2'-5' RNA ligase family protein [Streptomyces mobaraensis]KAB7835753.1 2'-5' RNA ligase family protein [Streptomyces mobaraensis]